MKTIKQVSEALKGKRCSALELTQDYISKAKSSANNSFITVTEEHALGLAKESDRRLSDGTARATEGVPCAVKDIFCTKEILTTCASKILANFVPPYESTVTSKLFGAGAIMIGKTNMDEFAMGSMTANSYYGPSINPAKSTKRPEKKLTPGGSSGGSAVSVAEGSSIFALGTDTGGSVRQPAAFCGIVGAKPSYGLCSRYGMISYASSLDQAGVFTNTVEDAATVLDFIAGHDQLDSTSIPQKLYKFKSFGEKISQGITGLRIGIPKEYVSESIHPDIIFSLEETRKELIKMGAEIVELSLPHSQIATSIYYTITTAEASSNLARYDGVRYGFSVRDSGDGLQELYTKTRGQGFGEEVKRRICLGNFVLSSGKYEEYYMQAMRIRRMIKNDFDAAFAKVDAILSPTTPNLPFPFDEKPTDPVVVYLNDALLVSTNLAGLPGISVPAGISKEEGLPVGVHIMSNYLEDSTMIQVASAVESIWKKG